MTAYQDKTRPSNLSSYTDKPNNHMKLGSCKEKLHPEKYATSNTEAQPYFLLFNIHKNEKTFPNARTHLHFQLSTGHNTKCDTSIMQAANLFALFISKLEQKYDLVA